MRRLLFSLFVFVAMSFCNANGQEGYSYIVNKIDSLDRGKAADYRVQAKKEKPGGCRYTIKVKNQAQFDRIDAAIKDAIEAGRKNIRVIVSRGIYLFRENHIAIGKGKYEEVGITIEGHNAVLTSDIDFTEDSYSISPWSELAFADGNIEVVDAASKLCRIPFKNNFSDLEKSIYTKVQVTQWFQAPVFGIVKIDDNGIYFTASEVNYIERFGRKGYTVNYDFIYSGKPPRFRLYNAQIERACAASTFLRVGNNNIRYLCVKGIIFKGNKAGMSLVEINNVKAGCIIVSDCTFDTIRGKVLSCVNSDNVTLEKSIIRNTFGNEVSFTDNSRAASVVGNCFENCNQGLSNSLCIRCNESEYYIADNVFRDFGYAAIGVGLWYGHEKKRETKGIIEHNEIFFTPEYAAGKEKHTLMDGGAIYVWTQNDDAIIRYNCIHDYVGMRSYSGIYCDDGASNCKIYGNVVLNTPDGCSILSHMVRDHKDSFRNNENNFISNNIVDGSVIFEGYGTEKRHCEKGPNIRLANSKKQQYENRTNYLEVSLEDIVVSEWRRDGGVLVVPDRFADINRLAGIRTKR